MQIPHHCTLCPRACGADRAAGQRGFCGADNTLRVARAALHHWEEPCLSGDPNAETGSGTVFFSGCTLKCCYCQNYPISQGEVGKAISVERLTEIFMNLQNGFPPRGTTLPWRTQRYGRCFCRPAHRCTTRTGICRRASLCGIWPCPATWQTARQCCGGWQRCGRKRA